MGALSGQTVLITGALGTIGQAMVSRYHEEGASVIALDLPDMANVEAKLAKLAPDVRYLGCDLGDLRKAEKAAAELAEEVGGVDILVNNAAFITNKPHEEYS